MPDHVRSLDRLRITSPCTADWNSMIGNDQVRFCEHCNLQVTDLSTMTRNEAMRLVARSRGRLCVRYIQRTDGRALTRQIPGQLYHIGRRLSRVAAGIFTATLSVSTAVAQTPSETDRNNLRQGKTTTQIVPESEVGAILSGVVRDWNGAIISGAVLTLTNTETHVALVSITNNDGTYRFAYLETGTYALVVEHPAFERTKMSNVALKQNRPESRDIVMAAPLLLNESWVELETIDTTHVTMGVAVFSSPADPLVAAASADDRDSVMELISASRDLNAHDPSSKMTALDYAVENGNIEMVRMLLAAGASPNAKSDTGPTSLMHLGENASVELVRELLSAGAKINARDESGGTALMNAASKAELAVVKELIGVGANVDLEDEDGTTAIMLAAGNDKPEMTKFLIEVGAKVDVKNHEGRTALMFAAGDGCAETVKLLINAGAEINARDNEGQTPLMIAADSGPFENVRALMDAGADIKLKDKNGQTALMLAASVDDAESVDALLDAGADVSAKDNEGKTALRIARERVRDKIVKLLESRGAPE